MMQHRNQGIWCLTVLENGQPGTVGTILRNGMERNGTKRNDGLNYGTERFLKLKLATYHC